MNSLVESILMLEKSRIYTESSIRSKKDPAKFWALLPKDNSIYILQKPDSMWDTDITMHHYYPKPTPMHKHDFYELIYVWKGHCINYLPNEPLHMKAGDVLLMNPDIYHSPFIDSPDNYVINILIECHTFHQIIRTLQSYDNLFLRFGMNHLYNLSKFSDYLYFPCNIDYPVYEIILNLTLELLRKDIMYQDAVFSSLITLFITLTRIYQKGCGSTVPDEKEEMIQKILGYIEKNLRDVSLQELTVKFHYSSGYLSNLIHEYTGKKFSDIVRNLRLDTAQTYLESGGYSLQQIAELCGFHDASYFSRVFKQQYGISPSTYAKKGSKKKNS